MLIVPVPYLQNRGRLVQICEDHREQIIKDIYKLVNDVKLVRNAESYRNRTLPIVVALDRSQRDNSSIAVAVEIWNELKKVNQVM